MLQKKAILKDKRINLKFPFWLLKEHNLLVIPGELPRKMANESEGIFIFLSSYVIPAIVKEVGFLLILNEMICSAKSQKNRGVISGNHKQIFTHCGLNCWENLWRIYLGDKVFTLYCSLFPSALVSTNTRGVLTSNFADNCMTVVTQIEHI